MKLIFVFLSLALVAVKAAEFGENTYWASDEENPYDEAFDSQNDGPDWIDVESLDMEIGFNAPEDSKLTVGPCVMKGNHPQIRMDGSIRHPSMQAMVVYNPDTENEEIHAFDLFSAETRDLHYVANIPHEVLLETDDPVIYFEPDGGHEKRMGECSTITEGVEYSSEHNQLRNSWPGNSFHTGGFFHGNWHVGCKKHNGAFFNGNGRWHKKHAKVGWRKKCPPGHGPGCQGHGRNADGDEVEIAVSDHDLLAGMNVTLDQDIESVYENAPFQIWIAYDSETVSDVEILLNGEKPTLTRDPCPGNGNCHHHRGNWYGWGGRKHRCHRPGSSGPHHG